MTAPAAPAARPVGDDDPRQRLFRLFGDDAMARLAGARVAVVGIGGVGSACAEALARGAVGGLVFVDGDTVAPSNINRQAVAFLDTVGRPKVDVMAAIAAQVNPAARVNTFRRFVLSDEAAGLLDEMGPVDYLCDAVDSIAVKLALAELAQERGISLVSAMGGANKVHPERIRVASIWDTVNDPICRVVRKECRKRGIRDLTVVFSDERPVPVAMEPGTGRAERTNLGTASFMPPAMGLAMAGKVIRDLTGVGA